MIQTIRFTIPGECKGKGRPRFSRQGNYVKTYTDSETALYENWVKSRFLETNQPPFEANVAIKCIITAWFSIPTSKSKKVKSLMAQNLLKPTKKPDCDNIAKIILDGLNSIAYKDDTQITTLAIRKYYTDKEPFVMVEMVEDREFYD